MKMIFNTDYNDKNDFSADKNDKNDKNEFNADENDKNEFKPYHKLREHCHYTGKFRGSAHSICNLRYTAPKKNSCSIP